MTMSSIQHTTLAQGGNVFVWVAVVVIALVILLQFYLFARIFSLWLRAFMARANVPMFQIIGMQFRKTNAAEIVKLKIMAVQSGVEIPTHELERAYLQGVNVERAVLAMIRAKQTGEELTWEQVVAADMDERLREME